MAFSTIFNIIYWFAVGGGVVIYLFIYLLRSYLLKHDPFIKGTAWDLQIAIFRTFDQWVNCCQSINLQVVTIWKGTYMDYFLSWSQHLGWSYVNDQHCLWAITAKIVTSIFNPLACCRPMAGNLNWKHEWVFD